MTNLHKFFFIILPISLALALVLTLVFISRTHDSNFTYRDISGDLIENDMVVTNETEMAAEFPAVPDLPDFSPREWEMEIVGDEEYTASMIFVMAFDRSEQSSSSYMLPGTLYTLNITDINSLEELNEYGFGQTIGYIDQLYENGWEAGLYLRYGDTEYSIQGMAADGVSGSSSGYIALANGQLKHIVVSYNSQWTYDDTEDGYFENSRCPCEVQLQIFESDPIDIEEILN